RRVTALLQRRDRRLGRVLRRHARRAKMDLAHAEERSRLDCSRPRSQRASAVSSDPLPTLRDMSKTPSRLELLELDIDLRLTDLWREAADISEWNLDVVAAFMRAAYGKGYCDALTEDARLALRRPRVPRARAPAAGRHGLEARARAARASRFSAGWPSWC